jgi:hypothetical protein
MSDRRKELRKKLMAFMPVHTAAGSLLGFLGDLTFQGALVIGEKPLGMGQQVILEITLPDDLPRPSSGHHLTIQAQVVRCVPDELAPHEFNLGFEFTSLNPEQIQLIHALLERYHFRYQSEE